MDAASIGTGTTPDPGAERPVDLSGLSSTAVAQRRQQYGFNEIAEAKRSPLRQFLRYFWGPIPWMIEVAGALSAIVRRWADLAIILVLLVFNAVVGFWQEYQAGNAVEHLRKRLALKARAKRDGEWREVPARELVPGDVVRLRLGDIIPADVTLLEGDYLSVDQSALTGESLPVEKKPGDVAYSGSVAKQGEMVGVVAATGMHTYFGHTAQLVSAAKSESHFQKAVLTIGDYLIYISLGLVAVLCLVGLQRHWPLLELAQFCLILTVASIPVAMPAVLSVTMAVGAVALSKMKAIVSRLESIEEMAGMDILCSDKTGTLTQNRLTLGEPILFAASDAQELILAGALASKEEDQDPIDLAVIQGLRDRAGVDAHAQEKFIPFDPITKRTEATVRDPHGGRFRVAKGAPQVILSLCEPTEEDRARAQRAVDDLAAKGYRTLGVARSDDGTSWAFLGILPLSDPPREDAAATIAQAAAHGVRVKMVTGDNLAIAREIAGQLGMGKSILLADELASGGDLAQLPDLGSRLERADGLAQVFPEHKYRLVKALQAREHLVGMTGDGVNDAPALKQADVGIAVSGATDAARAAADLILTAPGLSVITRAVEEARRIFERMNSYAIYRITETIRIMIFVVLSMVIYNFYPITAVMIILLALLNDIPIMTIAEDNTWLDPQPVRWNMHRVLTVSTTLGLTGVVESFGALVLARSWLGLGTAEVQSLIFLKLVVAGHLTFFVTRTQRPFFKRPHPAPLVLWSAVATKVLGTLAVAFGWFMAPLPWVYVGLLWAYALLWFLIEDLVKICVYRHLRRTASRHRHFLGTLKRSLHNHASG